VAVSLPPRPPHPRPPPQSHRGGDSSAPPLKSTAADIDRTVVETLLAAGASVERELESTLEQWADNEGHVFVRDALRRSAMRTR
jgi:hypothetical protein